MKRIRRAMARGVGHGASYVPWVTVRSFSSKGVARRIRGRVTGRVHHLQAGLEVDFFKLFDFLPEVSDIREQFPLLPPERTREIARELKVRHRRGSRPSDRPWVMTSDLRVSFHACVPDLVLSVTWSYRLEIPRIRDLLRVEEAYWRERGLEFRSLTERNRPENRLFNIDWLRYAWRWPESSLLDEPARRDLFLYLREPHDSLDRACAAADRAWSLDPGSALKSARWMLSQRRWVADLDASVLPLGPLKDLRVGSGWEPGGTA